MQLECPYCGEREVDEFQFRQLVPDAHSTSPCARVYERVNRVEDSVEYWQHVHGCRAWLVIRRDPTTSTVASVHVLESSR